jgi:hypothetical protein
MLLRCQFGNITSGEDGNGHRKVISTKGAYIELYAPEGSSVAYYWDGEKFVEVWTSE